MKNKTILGILALMVVGIVGAGIVSAHGGGSYGMMSGYRSEGYADMHDAIDLVFESGNYSGLENVREEYNMPMMYWVESEEDFELAKQMHERFEGSGGYAQGGYSGMPCHGWN